MLTTLPPTLNNLLWNASRSRSNWFVAPTTIIITSNLASFRLRKFVEVMPIQVLVVSDPQALSQTSESFLSVTLDRLTVGTTDFSFRIEGTFAPLSSDLIFCGTSRKISAKVLPSCRSRPLTFFRLFFSCEIGLLSDLHFLNLAHQ